MTTRQSVVVDACSAINLLASGREAEIITALNWTLLIVPEAKAEVRYLRGPTDEEGNSTKLPINWAPLEALSAIVVRPVAELGAELDAFVAAAAYLTDVDARAVAIAGVLGVPLLSDDGKVRRTFRRLYAGGRLQSTLSAIRKAANHLDLDLESQKQMLLRLRERASFAPPKEDPDREWYAELTGE